MIPRTLIIGLDFCTTKRTDEFANLISSAKLHATPTVGTTHALIKSINQATSLEGAVNMHGYDIKQVIVVFENSRSPRLNQLLELCSRVAVTAISLEPCGLNRITTSSVDCEIMNANGRDLLTIFREIIDNTVVEPSAQTAAQLAAHTTRMALGDLFTADEILERIIALGTVNIQTIDMNARRATITW